MGEEESDYSSSSLSNFCKIQEMIEDNNKDLRLI